MRERTVHADDFGPTWPLTVQEGVLRKYREGTVEAVTITVHGRAYALNGAAKAHALGENIEPIWSLDSDLDPAGKTRKNIGPLIDAGLELQPFEPATDSRKRAQVTKDATPLRVLREFLYVDSVKVRSLLAQLDGGVPEEMRRTDKTQATSGVGFRAIASHGREWGSEDTIQRSLADAVFPTLEEQLEAEGFLTDLSADLRSEAYWSSRAFRMQVSPGSFVRITSPAHLFDARYIARSFSSFAASIGAFLEMFPKYVQPHSKGSQSRPTIPRKSREAAGSQLEDSILDFPKTSILENVDPMLLRSIVKLTRGIFPPGLHLVSTPAGDGGPMVSARLQEGQNYLESDADVLFARYGIERPRMDHRRDDRELRHDGRKILRRST